MTIITLTSDWGAGNHYAGSVKGALLRHLPDATIVDITHDIASYDIMQASFIMKNAFPDFPANTIHLIGINTEGGIDSPHIAVKYKEQFFIGADNGIFSLIIGNDPFEAVELNIMQDTDYFTFSTRDVFVKAAAEIASSNSLDNKDRPYGDLRERFHFNPVVHNDKIIAKVIYTDNYGNVFVNIDKKLFREVGRGRDFMISFRAPGEGIKKLDQSYSDVVPGEKVALFGSTGFMEIAINQGKASSLLGLNINDAITVEFFKD